MSIAEICNKMYGKTIRECSNEQVYTALLALVKKVTEERKEAQERQEKENGKKVYYISAEFLIGKLLSNNLINLGLYEQVSQELEKNGKNKSKKPSRSRHLEMADWDGWQRAFWIPLPH